MWSKLMEDRILEAIRSGELGPPPPGIGAVDLTEYFSAPAHERVGNAILRNARIIPREIELLGRIAELESRIAGHGPDDDSGTGLREQWVAALQDCRTAYAMAMERRRSAARNGGGLP